MLGANLVTGHQTSSSGTRGYRRVVFGITAMLAVIAVGCGIPTPDPEAAGDGPSSASVGQRASEVVQVDFVKVRFGDRVTAFIGRSMPPSHWKPVVEAAQAAVDDCIVANGGDPQPRPPLEYPEYLELQGTNLAAFREQYGYGVVEGERTRMVAEAEAQAESIVSVPFELGLLHEKCANAGCPGELAATLRCAVRSTRLVRTVSDHDRFQLNIGSSVLTAVVADTDLRAVPEASCAEIERAPFVCHRCARLRFGSPIQVDRIWSMSMQCTPEWRLPGGQSEHIARIRW